MSQNAKLSQEEIEALLRQHSADSETNTPDADTMLSDVERDAIGEIGNISFGTAATTLSSLLHHRVEITTPDVQVVRLEDVQGDFPVPYVVVTVDYTEGLSGANALAIQIDDAKTIADLMMGGDGTNVAQELNELHLSAVAEAMNQMMGGAATAMSSMFNRAINISPPVVKFIDFASGDRPEVFTNEWVVNTAFRLRVGSLIDSRIMQWVPLPFARELLRLAGASFGDMATGSTDATGTISEPTTTNPTGTDFMAPNVPSNRTEFTSPSPTQASSQTTGVPLRTAAPVQPAYAEVAAGASVAPMQATYGGAPPVQDGRLAVVERIPDTSTRVQRPQFQDFDAGPASGGTSRNLSLLFDVQLNVTVELGRTKRPIRELLELGPGSIVELDKLAGEPVDILVNNKRIAIGEVVVIDENFGVRVTDILSPAERVRSFQS